MRERQPWAHRTPPGKKLAIRRDRLLRCKGCVCRAGWGWKSERIPKNQTHETLINGTEMINCLRHLTSRNLAWCGRCDRSTTTMPLRGKRPGWNRRLNFPRCSQQAWECDQCERDQCLKLKLRQLCLSTNMHQPSFSDLSFPNFEQVTSRLRRWWQARWKKWSVFDILSNRNQGMHIKTSCTDPLTSFP